MKKSPALVLLALFAVIGLCAARTMAKEKKEKATSPGEFRWHGSVVRSNKDQSTLTVRKGHVERTVHYDSSTQWTKDNNPSDSSAVKDGDSVIVLGKFDEKKELHATRIEIRPPKTMP